MAFTPDGKYAISGHGDNTLRLWDLNSGQLIHTFGFEEKGEGVVAISPDGQMAISSSKFDNTLTLWDIQAGKPIHYLEGHIGTIASVAISSDNKTAISGSLDHTLKLWDLNSGQLLKSIEDNAQRGKDTPVAISPIGIAVSSSGRDEGTRTNDEALKLWDVKTGQFLRSLEGHKEQITSIAISPTGNLVASSSWDHTLKLWNLNSGRLIQSIEEPAIPLSVAFLPDEKTVLSGSWDKSLRLWDLQTRKLIRLFEGHTGRIKSLAVSPDGKKAVSLAEDLKARLWDLQTGRLLHILVSSSDSSWAFSPDGTKIISGSFSSKTLTIFDVQTGEVLQTCSIDELQPPKKIVRSLFGHNKSSLGISIVFSKDEKSVFSFSNTSFAGNYGDIGSARLFHSIKLWDIQTGVLVRSFDDHTGNRKRTLPFTRWKDNP